MKRLLLLLLLTLPVLAKPTYTFVPGKSFGPVTLGQSPEQLKQALSDWTYDFEHYASGHLYHFPKTGIEQFNCAFTTDHVLQEVTLSSNKFKMKGDPGMGPGASQEAIQRRFGKPTTNTLDRFGGYWDYNQQGLCFFFPSSRQPAIYGKGHCLSVAIYVPGTSRYATK